MGAWFLTLVCALTTPYLSLGVFEPGCSFMNQQCIYNVKIGHEGQCDSPQDISHGSTQTCCNTVQDNVNSLQAVVSDLSKQLAELQMHAGQSQNKTMILAETTNERDLLLKELAEKAAELQSSQSNLADLVRRSAEAIQALKEELANATRKLNNCRGVLGLKTKAMPTTGSDHYVANVCTFEHGMCGYTMHTSQNMAHWKLAQGTSRATTGPLEDHTYGAPTGHYMLLDPKMDHLSRTTYNRSYELVSETFHPAPAYCIRFWYNMNGNDVRNFKVFAKISNGKGYPVWQSFGPHGQHWLLAEINLDSEYTSNNFTIIFEATTNANTDYYGHFVHTEGEIALDDIYVYNTSCHNIPQCPLGSIKFKGANSSSCYTFHTSPESWYNSSFKCHQEDSSSHLVSVNSKEEQIFIVNHIKQNAGLSAAGSLGYFTSGNDERKEGTFDWTDTGTPYRSQYSDWHAGQPNNVGSNQNCLLLQYGANDYEWGDVACAEKHPYICEVELVH